MIIRKNTIDFNPIKYDYIELKELVSTTKNKIKELIEKLDWHENTTAIDFKNDISKLNLSLKENEVEVLKLDLETLETQKKISLIEKDIKGIVKIKIHEDLLSLDLVKSIELDLSMKVDSIKENKKTLFNPLNWISREQKNLRFQLKYLKKELEDEKIKIQNQCEIINGLEESLISLDPTIFSYLDLNIKVISGLEKLKGSVRNNKKKHSFILKENVNINKDIDREKSLLIEHTDFDPINTHKDIITLRQKLSGYLEKIEKIHEVDRQLAPLINEIDKLKHKKSLSERIIVQANLLEAELNRANNSYERMKIHQKCEDLLGDGSPGMVLGRQKKLIRRIERDIGKIEKYAFRLGSMSARTIEAVVFDGNNMHYKHDRIKRTTVGLDPLICASNELRKKFKIFIVFDGEIRDILNKNDVEIESCFGDGVEVHIAAIGEKADKILLDYASKNKNTYVVSNDRFADFNHIDVVRDKRIIRFEIIGDYIQIHDLNVDIAWR